MKNKLINYFKSSAMISAIAIGIIGSALWEKIISPLSSFIFLQVLNISSKISETYTNNIYKSISKGFHEESSLLLLSCFLAIFLAYCFYTLIGASFAKNKYYHLYEKIHNPDYKSDKDKPIDLPSLKSKSKKLLFTSKILFIILIFLTLSYVVLFLYYFGRMTFINSSISKTLNNIEILSPYVSDYDYKMLKSKFHLIRNKLDYDALSSEIEDLLTTYSIILE
jgi:hypothetical protein